MKHRIWQQQLSRHRTELLLAMTLVLACGWLNSADATEVYKWTDEKGVVHFGDSPPPSNGSLKIEVEDVYQPGTTGAYPSAPQGTDAASAESPESPKSAAQQRREDIAKSRQERREAQVEAEELCARHRKRLEQMEPARRVMYKNEAGEEIRMDDDLRIGLIEESRDYIAKNCR
ncbi:MAG: DUF4124 domain-containing protein [Xanthomonadales bacterium]|nr:DUF4124 domain-containing protein [Gammaproteobacteria bacterium]MBT8052649.1 DUF4124 domain-containing protein [Gammaproteobacteria bacterium]NND56592.1 DUF4124 domain-containing protein [Xanthomonadales bacterium]NNK52466.1 DUF4124 domain-containing protein [Xanthomonadales bacterium]